MRFRMPHNHPFFKKCRQCNAASELVQILVGLLVYGLFFGVPIAYMAYKVIEAEISIRGEK